MGLQFDEIELLAGGLLPMNLAHEMGLQFDEIELLAGGLLPMISADEISLAVR